MNMCVYSFPSLVETKEDDIVAEARKIFDTYADDVQVDPFTGEVSIRNAVRLSEDSPYKDAMLNEDEFVELEKRFGLFSHLRSDDSGTGKDNINYISEYKVKDKDKDRYFDMNRSLRDYFMEERKNEEEEYWKMNDELSQEELDKLMDCGNNERHNRFLDDIDSLS